MGQICSCIHICRHAVMCHNIMNGFMCFSFPFTGCFTIFNEGLRNATTIGSAPLKYNYDTKQHIVMKKCLVMNQ